MSFLKEILEFILERKKFYMWPVLFALLVIGGLIIWVQGSAVAPFVYTLF